MEGREESPPIPQIEISHELGERLDSFWIPAKAKLIGHQSLLCVKSHLSTGGLWKHLIRHSMPGVRPPELPPQNFTH